MSQPRHLGYTIKPPTIDGAKFQAMVNRAAAAYSRRIAQRNEQIAREALRKSLRPRLRWIADRPNAHRYAAALVRIGWLTPPTATRDRMGRFVHITRKANA